MKKLAAVFILAILLPSVVLAWLAAFSLRDQRAVLEQRELVLQSAFLEGVAGEIRGFLLEIQMEFSETVDSLVAAHPAEQLLREFDRLLVDDWPLARLGFVIGPERSLLGFSYVQRPEMLEFLQSNQMVLAGETPLPMEKGVQTPPPARMASRALEMAETNTLSPPSRMRGESRDKLLSQLAEMEVEPETTPVPAVDAVPATDFRELIGTAPSGAVGWPLRDRLQILVWHRPADQWIYGAEIDSVKLAEWVGEFLAEILPDQRSYRLALSNDQAEPIYFSSSDVSVPPLDNAFAVAEIGGALPHWKLAVFPIDPGGLARSARNLQAMVWAMIGLMMVAILWGGWLLWRNVREEVTLARRKSDFVSNVTHELKSPLTSIRLYAGMLLENRVRGAEQRVEYLQTISEESERLSRLVSNVLTLGRRKPPQPGQVDLAGAVRKALESTRPALDRRGIRVEFHPPETAVRVRAEEDGLVSILVNLLSNIEKYAAEGGEAVIEIRVCHPMGRVRIMDRGPGLPSGRETEMFEAFSRGEEATTATVSGAGLGLHLARELARDSDGDLTYQPRPGGGAIFDVTLPLSEPSTTS